MGNQGAISVTCVALFAKSDVLTVWAVGFHWATGSSAGVARLLNCSNSFACLALNKRSRLSSHYLLT